MKRTFAVFAIGMAFGLGAGCSKSDTSICEDACNQGNACGAYLGSQDAGAGITITVTPTDCTAECANSSGSTSGSTGSSHTCTNEGAYDTCVNGINTSTASCLSDLAACATTNCN